MGVPGWLRGLRELPIVPRAATIGAVGLGAIGSVAGAVVGLAANPPTAPFAVVELGFPSALVGTIAGLGVGAAIAAYRRVRSRHAQPLPPR